jgi:hypothetical protein
MSSSFSDHSQATNSHVMSLSERAFERLHCLEDPRATYEARRIEECEARRMRCNSRWHPKCERWGAIAHRHRVEEAMRRTSNAEPMHFLTMGVGCDDAGRGLDVVRSSLQHVRRAKAAKGLHRGMGRYFVIASAGSTRWNCHLHAVVWGAGDEQAMKRRHEELAGSARLSGSLTLDPLKRRWADDSTRTFCSGGGVRDASGDERLDRAERRDVARARARAARPSARDFVGSPCPVSRSEKGAVSPSTIRTTGRRRNTWLR